MQDSAIKKTVTIENIEITNENNIRITLSNKNIIELAPAAAERLKEFTVYQYYRQEVIDYFTNNKHYKKSILSDYELINCISESFQYKCENSKHDFGNIDEQECLEEAIEQEEEELEKYKIKSIKF